MTSGTTPAPQPQTPRKSFLRSATVVAVAMAISDRVWSLGLREDGTIPDFLFEESVRAVFGYLGHYLPPCLELKLEAGA